MRSVFARLFRPNAQSVDRPGVDEMAAFASPHDPLWIVGQTPPARRSSRPSTSFHGDLVGPGRVGGPAPTMDPSSPPTPTVTFYARARHGEGLFGMEPLIPEGEVD